MARFASPRPDVRGGEGRGRTELLLRLLGKQTERTRTSVLLAGFAGERGVRNACKFTRLRRAGSSLQPATFADDAGFRGMKTFWKVLLIVVLALVAIKLLPVLIVPVIVLAFAAMVATVLLLGGFGVIAAAGLGVLAGLLAVVLTVLAVLSPIWIPVLVVIGIVALVRRANRAHA